MSGEDQRVLFISHLHEDKPIADAMRDFIENKCAPGLIKVYQSSDSQRAPRVGKKLNEELRTQLGEAGVVVCIYTSADHDWSYCMWECTIATEVEPEATLVLFQFTNDYPAPFQELVRVDARELTSIRGFVNNLFTEREFFGGFHTALAPALQPNADPLLERADAFHEVLKGLTPGGIVEWPAWGYIMLEFPGEDIRRINAEPSGDRRVALTDEILRGSAQIVQGDRTARGLFGRARFPDGLAFSDVLRDWKDKYPDAAERWVDSLARQIECAARDSFPLTDWVVMQGATQSTELCIPVVMWIRTLPSGDMQFDVYFIPVRDVDEVTGKLDLGIVAPALP